MSVLIQINGDTAAEALKELATLAGPLGGGQAAPAAAAEAPKSSRSRATKPDPKPEQAEPPVQNEPDPEPSGETDPESSNETDPEPLDETDQPGDDDAPIPTVVDLRAKAQEVGTTPEAKKAIKALLDEFGSKSISDVPDEKRAAFMARLEKLA